jgi:membrane-associated phospholipid phosphatase
MRRISLAAVLLVAAPASAQTEPLRAHWTTDAAVTVGALAVAGLATRLPLGGDGPWAHQLLPVDERVKANFSPPAARWSDVLAGVTLLGPLALQLRGGFDEAGGTRALIYGETIAANLALNGVTKVLVGRPRPYSYSDAPDARAQVQGSPRDARLSFYSGHASTTFAAAVAGSYLFSQSSDDPVARTAVWASSLMLAGATSNLRVRAGKHFYSDVLAGAAIGAGIGVLVPALHFGGHAPHALLPGEWVAIGTAPLAGALLSQVLPLPERTPLQARAVPWVTGKGAGLMVAGVF